MGEEDGAEDEEGAGYVCHGCRLGEDDKGYSANIIVMLSGASCLAGLLEDGSSSLILSDKEIILCTG